MPLNNATRGSNPPEGITVPVKFVPPPKPYVCNVTVVLAVRVKVSRKTSSGVSRVPIQEIPPVGEVQLEIVLPCIGAANRRAATHGKSHKVSFMQNLTAHVVHVLIKEFDPTEEDTKTGEDRNEDSCLTWDLNRHLRLLEKERR
jgi:hypothetical protein